MDVKNLLGKLHTEEGSEAPQAPSVPVPKKPVPRVEDSVARPLRSETEGRTMQSELDEGIVLDLGEGISLNIPIQRRMSLSDFIKLAEKVKALEMLSEGSEHYRRM